MSSHVYPGDVLKFAEDYKLFMQEKRHQLGVDILARVLEKKQKFKPSWFAKLFGIKSGLVFNQEQAYERILSEHSYNQMWMNRVIDDMTSLRYEASYYLKEGTQNMLLDEKYAGTFFKYMSENIF